MNSVLRARLAPWRGQRAPWRCMSTVDAREVAKFGALDWDGPEGAELARMHATRMAAIAARVPLEGKRVLDVGCGGGLLTRSLLAAGAEVVAIDAAEANVERCAGLGAEVRHCTVEDMPAADKFDAVMSLEVVEHVADRDLFVRSCANLSRGHLVLSTINRTLASYMLGIVAAEHVLRMVPAGTHDWAKFVTPEELERQVHVAGLRTDELVGLIFNPVTRRWSTSPDRFECNYMLFASR